MHRRHLLLILLVSAVRAQSPKKSGPQQCAAIDRQIRRLESKLRQGHSAAQGRSLKRRVRELQLRRFRECR